MTTRLHSKTLLFAFLAFMTCPVVWAVPDHTIEVSPKNGSVSYKHTKGKGAYGFVFLAGNQEIQWSSKNNDEQIVIDFGNAGPPCTNASGGPTATPSTAVTCDVDLSKVNNGCQKSSLGTQCLLYSTHIYKNGNQLSLTDDPELIVDGNGGYILRTSAVALVTFLLGLASGIFGKRWFGKARSG